MVFPKKNRLLLPKEYQRVFKQGRKLRGGTFILFSCLTGSPLARLGLAIAKRHIPLAVERNRVRRLVRESFRHRQGELKGVDIVVIMQTGLRDRSNADLQRDLERQWQILVGSLKAQCSV